MKKIRTLLAVLLAVSLLLCGCSGESDDYAEEDIMAEETMAADEDEADQEEVPDAKNLTLGQVVEGVYTNEYLDAYFAPNGWTVRGAGELQDSLSGIVEEMVEGTELESQLEGLTQVMDMQGVAPDGVSNVNVVYTKMGAVERMANLALDEEEALDAVLENMDALVETYANAGISVASMTKVPVNYRGEERLAIRTLGTVQGVNMCILQVYERTLGSYSVVVTATALDEAEAVNIMGMFEKLNP